MIRANHPLLWPIHECHCGTVLLPGRTTSYLAARCSQASDAYAVNDRCSEELQF